MFLKFIRKIYYNNIIGVNKSFAFTLAEVLITLGIIGIVAKMTIPTLVENEQEKSTVTALKEFYSSISQAYLEAKNDNGTPDEWYNNGESIGSIDASNRMFEIFKPYLKISKACYQGQGCFPDVTYKKIDGNDATNWNRYYYINTFLIANGMSVFFYSYGNHPSNYGTGLISESYGAIAVDINGFKKPNVYGKDMFSFILTKNGIVPNGIQNLNENDMAFPHACNRKNCYGWCEGCAAWVIYNENMDYLHCDDLSWNGKLSCK